MNKDKILSEIDNKINSELAKKNYPIVINGVNAIMHSVVVGEDLHSCKVVAKDNDGVAVRGVALFCADRDDDHECGYLAKRIGSTPFENVVAMEGDLLELVKSSVLAVNNKILQSINNKEMLAAMYLAVVINNIEKIDIVTGQVYKINYNVLDNKCDNTIYGVVVGEEVPGVSYTVALNKGGKLETVSVNWFEFVKMITQDDITMTLGEMVDQDGIH